MSWISWAYIRGQGGKDKIIFQELEIDINPEKDVTVNESEFRVVITAVNNGQS